jgi:hypothetical protein
MTGYCCHLVSNSCFNDARYSENGARIYVKAHDTVMLEHKPGAGYKPRSFAPIDAASGLEVS